MKSIFGYNYLKMSNKRKTIAIDMDGVIADTVAQFILWYEKEFGERIEKSFSWRT